MLGKPSLNKHKGTASIKVGLPGPGKATLSGKDVKPASVKTGVAASHRLAIEPKGKLRKKLKKKGKAQVTITVAFKPEAGTKTKASRKVTLKQS